MTSPDHDDIVRPTLDIEHGIEDNLGVVASYLVLSETSAKRRR
jgi:hypothetical protein